MYVRKKILESIFNRTLYNCGAKQLQIVIMNREGKAQNILGIITLQSLHFILSHLS